jgi:UDP-N-acetylmuramoylalanine--D-glutamate ligase
VITPVAQRVLVVGLAATGAAVVRRLRQEGADVVVVDDRAEGAAYEQRAAEALALGATVVARPGATESAKLARGSSLVVPSPLVDGRHPAIVAAREEGVPVRSEIDLAAERTDVPIVAVTGTNGKTTVTSLIEVLLRAGGRRPAAAGNIGNVLLDAVGRAAGREDDAADDVDVFVVEVSSYQLAFCEVFRPRVAVLLAVAPDHLDWHGTFAHYAAAKARIFARQHDDDLLVYDADDEVASRLVLDAPARTVGVSLDSTVPGCYTVRDGRLVTPGGDELVRVDELRRALPHDCTNALAAAAVVHALGVPAPATRAALASYATLPHRVALVGEASGVQWYDDSKATNPHAALHAVRAFGSVVLLAGGRNKGLDLSVLADASSHLRAVVAFGESAPEIERAFAGIRPVTRASTMREAVRAAHATAQPGDVVLLSPGCASFDAYQSYAARGDDFAAEVRELIGVHA